MRLFCPNCMKPVTLPEEAAGTEASCPNCGKPFPVPARYNPVVATPPPAAVPPVIPPEPPPMSTGSPADRPPPGLVPTALVPPTAAPGETPVPPTPPAPAGYTRSFGVVFSPWWVTWVPVLGLTVAVVATFFPWVGSYFAGYPVYSETPWQAIVGGNSGISRDFNLEKPFIAELKTTTTWIDKVPSDWELMLPFVVLLILATVLAWGDRLFPVLPGPGRLPRWLHWLVPVWPRRAAILAGLAGVSLVLILSEVGRGLPLERSLERVAAEAPAVAEKYKSAAGSAADKAAAENMQRQELAKYNLRRTWWLTVGVGCHVLAVLGLATVALLHRRGTKPPPRIVVQY